MHYLSFKTLIFPLTKVLREAKYLQRIATDKKGISMEDEMVSGDIILQERPTQ